MGGKVLGVRGANLSDAVRVHMRNSLFWTQHFSHTANNSSHSPNVEQGVREITANAASEDMASDSQQKYIRFPVHTTVSAENADLQLVQWLFHRISII